jgi:hypothetical protein
VGENQRGQDRDRTPRPLLAGGTSPSHGRKTRREADTWPSAGARRPGPPPDFRPLEPPNRRDPIGASLPFCLSASAPPIRHPPLPTSPHRPTPRQSFPITLQAARSPRSHPANLWPKNLLPQSPPGIPPSLSPLPFYILTSTPLTLIPASVPQCLRASPSLISSFPHFLIS